MKKFLFSAVFTFFAACVFSQERIAVFPFEDLEKIFTPSQAALFYREFSNEFTNRSAGRFSIVPRQDVERLINIEAAFQLTDFSAREKTAEMQRVLNGTQILSGVIGRVEGEIRITVSLYTYPELVQLRGGATLKGADIPELFSKIPELVQNMQNIITTGVIEQSIPEGLLYEIVDGRTVTITMYIGNAAVLNIPSQIESLPVTAIGDGAFSGRDSLTNVTIPFSVTSIGDGAFWGCSSLTSVTIPSSVTSIGHEAFDGCSSLTGISVDSRNPAYASIDGVLFDKNIQILISYPQGRNQRTYVIPSSVTAIGEGAFRYCSLTSVTIPSSVTAIGRVAFAECRSLTNVTIPSSVTAIGIYAFAYCSSLTSVTLSRRTSVGEDAFPDWTRIIYRD